MKLLLVEDSERLRRSLGRGLVREGFAVDMAADGEEGYGFANAYHYDVIVLDLMLPKLPGLDLLKQLRREGNQSSILILSAKDQVGDRVKGLELGADDYLIKPFAFDELCARIRTLGRRRHDIRNPIIQLGSICVDTARCQVKRNDKLLALTPLEYQLLECLALRRGRVISKELLRYWLYDSDAEASSNVIEALVSSLRKKLRSVGADQVVKTRRGFGYLVE
ncbi:MAG: response regulator transcription factor [Desulfobacteraceae bacterium]|jgi:two-component system copper resistance phosphate regulon response regulator CusR